MVSDMTHERAQKIFAHVAEQRLRWGKQYDGSDEGIHNLLDAIVVIAHTKNNEDAELRAEITKLNRQLGAARAREAKRARTSDVDPIGFTEKAPCDDTTSGPGTASQQ